MEGSGFFSSEFSYYQASLFLTPKHMRKNSNLWQTFFIVGLVTIVMIVISINLLVSFM